MALGTGARGRAVCGTIALAAMVWAPTGAATAGEAPVLIAEPELAQPLEPCPQFGRGFIRKPGTDHCFSVGGQITVSHEAGFADRDLFAETSYVAGEPFIIYDLVEPDTDQSRFETDAIVSVTTATPTARGPLLTVVSLRGTIEPDTSDTIFLDQAFIDLDGFTIGRRASFFDFSSGLSETAGYASNTTTNLAAYTRRIGERGRVTVSIEDSNDRRAEEGVWALRGAHALPDLVVAARLDDRRWGAAQVSAALIHLTDDRETACCGRPADRLGFAVSAGVEYRTQIAGRFARLILSGAYAEGGVSYLGGLPFASDYLVDGDGAIKPTRGYSLMASYEHVWRDNLKSTATLSGIAVQTRANTLDWRASGILASVGSEFMPVPGLQVGLEGSYFIDTGKARYFGVDGETSQADFFKLTTYARRPF